MLINRKHGFQDVITSCKIGAATLTFWLQFLIFQQSYEPNLFKSFDRYLVYNLCLAFGLILFANGKRQRSRALQKAKLMNAHRYTLKEVGVSIGCIVIFLVASKDRTISRLFLLIYIPILYSELLLCNVLLEDALARLLFRGSRGERLAMIGTRRQAVQILPWLKNNARLGIEVIGLVEIPEEGEQNLEGIQGLGSVDHWEKVIVEREINTLLLLDLPSPLSSLAHFAAGTEKHGVRLLIHTDIARYMGHSVRWFENDGVNLIGLRDEPLENPLNLILKRSLDIAISLPVVLCLLPPISLGIWIVQKRQSKGPLIFRQVRGGLLGQRFEVLKFRSMNVANPKEEQQACRNDPRIYPLGQFLRRTSIDELPQFINVLKGNMSVVGPRPHLLKHDAEFAKIMGNYHVRSRVKPGITGLAQIRGYRGETNDNEALIGRIKSDIQYIENWSLASDCLIIARTVFQIWSPPETAY